MSREGRAAGDPDSPDGHCTLAAGDVQTGVTVVRPLGEA